MTRRIEPTKLVGGRALTVSSPIDVANLLKDVLDAAQAYAVTREEEATKREAIAARRDVLLSEIEAKRELFITYLNRSFDERERNFEKLFAVLDEALGGDGSQVASILGSITTLAASSPFKELHDIEFVRAAVQDPDHVWDV